MSDPSDLSEPGRLLELPAGFWSDTPRWAVRHRLPGGGATDVVGHVLVADGSGVVLLPQDGPAVRIARGDIVAHRVVPPRSVRPASSAQALELLAARGWPGTRTWRLGGWLLRAGHGYTSRANSCVVAGDPGVPVEEALRIVADHYARLGRRAVLALAHDIGSGIRSAPGSDVASRGGSPPDDPAELTRRVEAAADAAGWHPYGPTRVFTAELRRLLRDAFRAPDHDDAPLRDGLTTRWSTTPDDDWLSLLHQGEALTHPFARAVITASPADYLTLSGPDGEPVAIGRLARTDDWVGLSCLEVAAPRRGRGLGRRATTALLERARADRARFAYLQVTEDNSAALALYRSTGFALHHTYHYRRSATG